eukprot:749950-Hanusia_phi.AAC.1
MSDGILTFPPSILTLLPHHRSFLFLFDPSIHPLPRPPPPPPPQPHPPPSPPPLSPLDLVQAEDLDGLVGSGVAERAYILALLLVGLQRMRREREGERRERIKRARRRGRERKGRYEA